MLLSEKLSGNVKLFSSRSGRRMAIAVTGKWLIICINRGPVGHTTLIIMHKGRMVLTMKLVNISEFIVQFFVLVLFVNISTS